MSKTLMIKAMVLGAVACAFSATGFAADVQNGHGQGIADSTTEVNEAKYDAVRSNWMDRTDIGIGLQGTQKDYYHDYAMPNKQMTDNNLSYDSRFHYRNHNSKQKMNSKY